jgi:hypothetical protein
MPFITREIDMRTIIDGMAYDTDTAEFIAQGDHDHPASGASWSLYRTPNGAFFEVYVGHDGVVEEINPFTNKQARRFLEKTANHLVEKYFGPMPEAYPPAPLRFSRRTVIAAIELLERLTHAQLTRFALKLGPEFLRRVGLPPQSVANRLNNLISIVDAAPEQHLDNGELLRDALVDAAVGLIPHEREYDWQEPPSLRPSEAAFLRALEVDGFTVSGGELRRTLPVDVGLPTAQSEIDRLIEKHGFTTAKGHLKQALDAHARGNWAAANSQIRTFMDALLDEIAVNLDPTASSLSSGQPRRTKLASIGFLSRELNEWDDNGLGFVNGLMKRLHPQGSHPGLSDDDDSTFRLHVVLLTAQLLLARFDTWR